MQKGLNPLIRDVYRRLRDAMGVEQAIVAAKIGVSASKLSRWEQDKGGLKDEQIVRLGEELRALAQEHEKKYADNTLEIFTRQLFRQLREAHGISQTALAERAGLLQFTISMFETGHTQLKRHEAERANNALKAVMAEREKEIKQYQEIAASLQRQAASLQRQVELHQANEESLRREVGELEGKQKHKEPILSRSR